MGGVNHRGVTSSKLNHTIRNLSVSEKQKLTWGLEVDNWKAVPVQNRLKTTRNLVRKQSYYLFLGWVILEQKTGCSRVHPTDRKRGLGFGKIDYGSHLPAWFLESYRVRVVGRDRS